MTPSRLHVPPGLKPGASASTCGLPPVTSIFFSFPSAKNPMKRLSGDQNGQDPPSVPGSDCASEASNDLTQSRRRALGGPAAKAMRRPSGDTAGGEPPNANCACSGGRIDDW